MQKIWNRIEARELVFKDFREDISMTTEYLGMQIKKQSILNSVNTPLFPRIKSERSRSTTYVEKGMVSWEDSSISISGQIIFSLKSALFFKL